MSSAGALNSLPLSGPGRKIHTTLRCFSTRRKARASHSFNGCDLINMFYRTDLADRKKNRPARVRMLATTYSPARSARTNSTAHAGSEHGVKVTSQVEF